MSHPDWLINDQSARIRHALCVRRKREPAMTAVPQLPTLPAWATVNVIVGGAA